MPPFPTRQGAGASGIKAVEMKAGLPSSGHGEIGQAHVRLLTALRLTPSANRRLSPVTALKARGIDPGRHRPISVARGHTSDPSIRLRPGGADNENLVYAELLGVTDDARSISGWAVRPVDTIQVIGSGVFQVISQMPDRGKSLGGPEHLLAVTLGGNLFLAPMHLDGLLILAPDDRNPHPNIGFASLRIPTLDLKIQWLALGRETDVLPPGLRLAEIEIVLVQTNQYWEVFQDCRGRQVRPSGVRDEIHRARMFPVAILCRSLGKESGKEQKKNQSGQEVYRIHFFTSLLIRSSVPRSQIFAKPSQRLPLRLQHTILINRMRCS